MPASDPVPDFQVLKARRVVAEPAALDALQADHRPGPWLRLAADEMLIIDPPGGPAVAVDGPVTADPHAIDVADAGWTGAWLDEEPLLNFLSWATTWPVGHQRPQLLQGMAAAVPVKVWLAARGPALLLVPTPVAHELAERWR